MTERTYRTRIEDLASVGEELSEEHLKLVAGAAKKKQGSGRQALDGTCTTQGTYNYDGAEGAHTCEQDGDED